MYISIVKPPQDTFGFQKVEVTNFISLSELCLENNISTGIFKGGHRNRENFEIAYCLGLDIDNDPNELKCPPMSLEEAKVEFSEYMHIILPSRSHRKEKHGHIADRFRVILILESPITDQAVFAETWHWCKAKWPAIDNKCKDPSRLWYQHSAIANIQDTGRKLAIVQPKPKEVKEKLDLSGLSLGDRGKLSRETLEFLVTGAEKGNRNGSTYKVAKEFQQNLYTIDEAESKIIGALEATGTLSHDFTEAEVRQTIRSAFATDAKHDPRIKPKAFKLISLEEIYRTESKIEWLVKDLLAVGGVSLISSEPKAGKSVLVRQLMRDVVRGEEFLGRQCKQGTVHYYALEEQIEVINTSFQRLGVKPNEPLLTHIGDPASDENAMIEFQEQILQDKPVLAVVDTLFDLVTADENNYKEVKREMRRLRKIARESGTHILLVHHNGKSDPNPKYKRRGQRGILGSTAIAGGVDTILVMDVDGHKRYMTATGREVKRFDNCLLRFDYNDCTYSLGPKEDEF